MFIIIHEYDLGGGIKAEIAFDLRIMYGKMIVDLPLPRRPFFTNNDEPLVLPALTFISGGKKMHIRYHTSWPPYKNLEGNVIEPDYDRMMTITISKGGKEKGYFTVEKDKDSESDIEIYRHENDDEKIPCSKGRRNEKKRR